MAGRRGRLTLDYVMGRNTQTGLGCGTVVDGRLSSAADIIGIGGGEVGGSDTCDFYRRDFLYVAA